MIELDEEYLGKRLPGDQEQRAELLKNLANLLNRNGERWIRNNAGRLLAEAEFIVDQ